MTYWISLKKLFNKAKVSGDDEDEEKEDDNTRDEKKKSIFSREKREPSIEDTVCTESLEHVKVYSNMDDFRNAMETANPEQTQLDLSSVGNRQPVSQTETGNTNYTLPTLDLLDKPKSFGKVNSTEFLQIQNPDSFQRV